jgi:hypothetical protein
MPARALRQSKGKGKGKGKSKGKTCPIRTANATNVRWNPNMHSATQPTTPTLQPLLGCYASLKRELHDPSFF